MSHPPASKPALRPAGRYEWEQIIRRARLTGVIAGSGRTGKDGRSTRGGISAATIKAVALAYASYANDKGAEIYPGDATIAVDLECTLKTVTTVKRALLDLGLMRRVAGRRGGHGEEYRLTLPEDLLERLEVLTPAHHAVLARRLRDERRGKRGGSGGPPDGPTDTTPQGCPPDPPSVVHNPVDNPPVGGPEDTPNEPDPETLGGSSGPAHESCGGSAGPRSGGPADPRYRPGPDQYYYRPNTRDLRSDLAVARARGSDQDRILEVVQTDDPTPGPAPIAALIAPQGATDPPPARTGLGFCVTCYAAGQTTVATDPIAGSHCAHHTREAIPA